MKIFDWLLDEPSRFFGAIVVGFILVVGWALYYDYQHPCIEYSKDERLLYMQKVGETLIPIYGHECLARK